MIEARAFETSSLDGGARRADGDFGLGPRQTMLEAKRRSRSPPVAMEPRPSAQRSAEEGEQEEGHRDQERPENDDGYRLFGRSYLAESCAPVHDETPFSKRDVTRVSPPRLKGR
jgi:hypothetical protein